MVKPENKIGCDSPGGQQAQCHYNDSKSAFLCCVARPCVLLPQARALAPRTCSVSGQPISISLDGLDCSLLSILVAPRTSSNPSTSAPGCATRTLTFGSKKERVRPRQSVLGGGEGRGVPWESSKISGSKQGKRAGFLRSRRRGPGRAM